MNIYKVMLTLLLFVALATVSYGQTPESKSDTRIKQQLDELGYKYSYTDEGNFKLVFRTKDDRTQIVFVYSKTNTYEGMEVREITSPLRIEQDRGAYGFNDVYNILEKNQTYKIGAWQINGGTSPFVLEFAIKLSAVAKKDMLGNLLQFAAKVADGVEAETSTEDKY
ncbi:MAG: hypothetical protein RIS47_853 [Bacteroidota bacterium]|jgi:hypothetical protein